MPRRAFGRGTAPRSAPFGLSRGFEVEVPRGSTFYREGGAPRPFLVRSGLIRVYMQSAEGRQVTVRYARPNDLLGIAAAVAGPAPVAAQALVDSRLLAFDPAALAEEAHRDPVVAWAIAEELGRRLYESLDHLAVNAFGSVRERTARHLLDAATPGKGGLPKALPGGTLGPSVPWWHPHCPGARRAGCLRHGAAVAPAIPVSEDAPCAGSSQGTFLAVMCG